MSLVFSASTPLLRSTEAAITYTNDLSDVLSSLAGDTDPALTSVVAVTFEQTREGQFSWAITLESETWDDASNMLRSWSLSSPISGGYAAVSVVVGTATAAVGTWYRLGVTALTNTGRTLMGDYIYVFCDQ